ncbi:hypothetical protein XELAEV_18002041mg [Xenopus laevis]|uniref:Uncharacterized protein n=1 Tax=Xenopus laevis TaxID=8355 RepID=A0A974BNM9_XENLA|nr:hypothetical protein XELAEV_18002041mg [Xenopus laevis]
MPNSWGMEVYKLLTSKAASIILSSPRSKFCIDLKKWEVSFTYDCPKDTKGASTLSKNIDKGDNMELTPATMGRPGGDFKFLCTLGKV